jgi:hypothetical protein
MDKKENNKLAEQVRDARLEPDSFDKKWGLIFWKKVV